MSSQEDEFIAHWEGELASLRRQLGYFEQGKMRWKFAGKDRTEDHKALLKKMIGSIEKMLDAYTG
ncbi:hypothetical protein [Sphingomonas sp.]|uniref:hypothetical protein n=1 Tax=Sphingomonas sp. TaxID=28214 RepID=UPI0038A70CAA